MDKNPNCPRCGSNNTIQFVYGLPGMDLLEKAEKGEIVLGGCCLSEDGPHWHCKDCNNEWGIPIDPLYKLDKRNKKHK